MTLKTSENGSMWAVFFREIKAVLDQYHELDKQIAVLKTKQQMDVDAGKEALLLQTTENDKHFLILNNEYKRIDKITEGRVDQGVYGAERAEILKSINALTTFKDNYEGRQMQRQIQTVRTVLIISTAVSLLFFLLNKFWN